MKRKSTHLEKSRYECANALDGGTGQDSLGCAQTCTIILGDYLWHRTRQTKTQTRVDSAVRDTHVQHRPLHYWISNNWMWCVAQNTNTSDNGEFVEQLSAKLFFLVSTALEGGKHDETGECMCLKNGLNMTREAVCYHLCMAFFFVTCMYVLSSAQKGRVLTSGKGTPINRLAFKNSTLLLSSSSSKGSWLGWELSLSLQWYRA